MLRHWKAAELDLHETFGIDVDEPGLLERRTWRWLLLRLSDLVVRPGTRIGALVRAPDEEGG